MINEHLTLEQELEQELEHQEEVEAIISQINELLRAKEITIYTLYNTLDNLKLHVSKDRLYRNLVMKRELKEDWERLLRSLVEGQKLEEISKHVTHPLQEIFKYAKEEGLAV